MKKDNLGWSSLHYRKTSEDSQSFTKLSTVARMNYHGTKQFFPQETWEETALSFPVQKVNDEMWGDTQLSERERLESLSEAINLSIEETLGICKTKVTQEVLRQGRAHYEGWLARVRRVHETLPCAVKGKWNVKYEVETFFREFYPLMSMPDQDKMGKRIVWKLHAERKEWEEAAALRRMLL